MCVHWCCCHSISWYVKFTPPVFRGIVNVRSKTIGVKLSSISSYMLIQSYSHQPIYKQRIRYTDPLNLWSRGRIVRKTLYWKSWWLRKSRAERKYLWWRERQGCQGCPLPSNHEGRWCWRSVHLQHCAVDENRDNWGRSKEECEAVQMI